MAESPKLSIVKDAIRRFPDLPTLTIAKHILHTHGEVFDCDLEYIRTRVRKCRGQHGEKNRETKIDKSLFASAAALVMPKTWRQIRTPYNLRPGLWLVMQDVHVPFHDIKAVEAAIKYGQIEQVDGIVLNGDIQDCASVGFWITHHRDTNREIEATIDFLDFLQHEFPGKPIIYKPGNHEYRLPRLYLSKVPELAETPYLAMESVLGLEARGIEFLDYFQIIQAGKLPLLHGHEYPNVDRSVNPARGLFLRAKTYAACGHCHTTSEHSARNLKGELLTTWSFGCLCDLSPDFRPYNDWNWGFALINVEKDGNFNVINKRILPSYEVV